MKKTERNALNLLFVNIGAMTTDALKRNRENIVVLRAKEMKNPADMKLMDTVIFAIDAVIEKRAACAHTSIRRWSGMTICNDCGASMS